MNKTIIAIIILAMIILTGCSNRPMTLDERFNYYNASCHAKGLYLKTLPLRGLFDHPTEQCDYTCYNATSGQQTNYVNKECLQ